MKLVTLEQARAHLRSDTSADDESLSLMIEAASDLVVDYVGDYEYADFDSAGVILNSSGDPENVVPRVQHATLVTVASMYRERDGSQENRVDAVFGYGYGLPRGAMALLYSLRKPTVA